MRKCWLFYSVHVLRAQSGFFRLHDDSPTTVPFPVEIYDLYRCFLGLQGPSFQILSRPPLDRNGGVLSGMIATVHTRVRRTFPPLTLSPPLSVRAEKLGPETLVLGSLVCPVKILRAELPLDFFQMTHAHQSDPPKWSVSLRGSTALYRCNPLFPSRAPPTSPPQHAPSAPLLVVLRHPPGKSVFVTTWRPFSLTPWS